jgi:cysteinyl-tRNA synthetase
VVGIDEKTALVVYPHDGTCRVIGLGGVTLIHTGQPHQDSNDEDVLNDTELAEVAQQRKGHVHRFHSGQSFSLSRIGVLRKPHTGADLPEHVWLRAIQAYREPADEKAGPPQAVLELVRERESARQQKDWTTADRLRDEIVNMGWQVQDTPDGARLEEITKDNP